MNSLSNLVSLPTSTPFTENRAIQDVWITPPRHGPYPVEQSLPWGEFGNQYGTTIRVYDPKINAWHITYLDPCSGYQANLIGQLKGDEIVQQGTGSDGALLRWLFSNIQSNAFRWHAKNLTSLNTKDSFPKLSTEAKAGAFTYASAAEESRNLRPPM